MSNEIKKEGFILPRAPIKAELLEPDDMILIGHPKIGKTVSTALIPNTLVLSFESKKQTTDGMFVYLDSIDALKRLCAQIKSEAPFYRFAVIDTVTKMEELAVIEAERIYMSTVQGKNWIKKIRTPEGKVILHPECGKAKYGNILQIPEGYGYPYLTTAMRNIKKLLESTFPKRIYLAHVKEKYLKNSDSGDETSVNDINLTGKNKHIYSAYVHAVGYFERIGLDLYINFRPTTDIVSGCQISRISDKLIKISTKKENGEIETYWEDIFPSIKKQNKKLEENK